MNTTVKAESFVTRVQRVGPDRIYSASRFLKEAIAYEIRSFPAGADEEKKTLTGSISRGAFVAYVTAFENSDDAGMVLKSVQSLADAGMLARATYARYFRELLMARHPFVVKRDDTNADADGRRYQLTVYPIHSTVDRITLQLWRPLPSQESDW